MLRISSLLILYALLPRRLALRADRADGSCDMTAQKRVPEPPPLMEQRSSEHISEHAPETIQKDAALAHADPHGNALTHKARHFAEAMELLESSRKTAVRGDFQDVLPFKDDLASELRQSAAERNMIEEYHPIYKGRRLDYAKKLWEYVFAKLEKADRIKRVLENKSCMAPDDLHVKYECVGDLADALIQDVGLEQNHTTIVYTDSLSWTIKGDPAANFDYMNPTATYLKDNNVPIDLRAQWGKGLCSIRGQAERDWKEGPSKNGWEKWVVIVAGNDLTYASNGYEIKRCVEWLKKYGAVVKQAVPQEYVPSNGV